LDFAVSITDFFVTWELGLCLIVTVILQDEENEAPKEQFTFSQPQSAMNGNSDKFSF
jgi:hypothetical protein